VTGQRLIRPGGEGHHIREGKSRNTLSRLDRQRRLVPSTLTSVDSGAEEMSNPVGEGQPDCATGNDAHYCAVDVGATDPGA
jgi:hypothetical protein